MDGWVLDYNATSCPQLTAEAEFESVELVSWGQMGLRQMWKKFDRKEFGLR